MAVRPTLNILSLCAGVGGLELGILLALAHRGGVGRGICYVEREAAAAASLVASMDAGWFHPAPIWSDMLTFDARPWRGLVHILASGDPCQDNSVAGQRAGASGKRFLAPEVCRIADECRPDIIFRENVAGNAGGQLGAIVPALERLGYRVAAGIFSSAETGNSMRRERLFIMAQREGGGFGEFGEEAWAGGVGHADGGSKGLGSATGEGPLPGAQPGADRGDEGRGPRDAQSQRRSSDQVAAPGAGLDLGGADDQRHERSRSPRRRGTGPASAGSELAVSDGGHARAERQQRSREQRLLEEDDGSRPVGIQDADCGAASTHRPLGMDSASRGRHGHAEQEIRAGRDGAFAPIVVQDDDCGGPAGAGQARSGCEGPQGRELSGASGSEQRIASPRPVAELRGALFPPAVIPGPDDAAGWQHMLDRWPEYQPALSQEEAQSHLRRGIDALAFRTERLRATGNGVDPIVAAYAFLCLNQRLRECAPT